MYVYIRLCFHVRMYACINTCACVCIHVHVYLNTYVLHVYVYVNMRVLVVLRSPHQLQVDGGAQGMQSGREERATRGTTCEEGAELREGERGSRR